MIGWEAALEHKSIAMSIASRLYNSKNRHFQYQDLVQEALIGMALAPSQETYGDFHSYLYMKGRCYTIDQMRKHAGRKLQKQIPELFIDGPERGCTLESTVELDDQIARLKVKAQKVVRMRALGYSLDEIGKELGVTESRVCQILKEVRSALAA